MKVFRAGRYIKIVRYTRSLPHDTPPARNAKSQKSTAAQRYINIRDCTERLQWLLCANFDHWSACFCTYTFTDDHLPSSRDAVKKLVKKHIRQLRTAFAHQNRPLPVIYTVEGQPGNSKPQASNTWEVTPWKDGKRWQNMDDESEDEFTEETVRLHAHVFMHLEGKEDRELVRSMWPFGHIYINSIKVNDPLSFPRLAAYVTKESRLGIRPENERSYIPSQGLTQPDTDGHWCSEFEGIAAPANAERLASGESHDDIYGSHMEYAMFRLPREAQLAKPYKSKGRIKKNPKPPKTK